jgi:NAD(P)-dependent dehydrogenase (short-subunit alcohol dehydrogenase family)
MSESLFIVTGASRGMGAAIASQLLRPGHVVLGISRHVNAALADEAASAAVEFEQWPRDLAQPVAVADEIEAWLQRFEPSRFDQATLINNAGVITRVGPIDDCSNAELSAALRVGLEAALLLSASFLRATRGWQARTRGTLNVLNISSGLGRRAMAGSAPYCAVKAGMDHLSRALALDEAHRGGGAKVVSLAPGVIDTDMQVQLRSADAAGFPDRGNFVKLQTTGQLSSPHEAAARILSYLQRPDFGANPVADVRDA